MAEANAEPKPALWETDVRHPEGGWWRVRTQDLQLEPLQMTSEMVKTIIGNRGRFMTYIYGPDGGQYRWTGSFTRAEAEEIHDRMVERIRAGSL